MRSSFPARHALASLAPLALACSARLATPGSGQASGGEALEPDAAEGASSAAFIVLERTVSADDTARGSAVARFIKMRSGFIDDDTLRMVGATLDLPALGTCATAATAVAVSSLAASPSDGVGASSDILASDGPRAVELLDVGAITFEANGLHTTLEARSLPDIVDLVTGVLYSTRMTTLESDGLPARGSYLLQSSGSNRSADPDRSVPAFAVSATAPGEPDELRIDGQDARAADGITLTSGARVELAWAASNVDGAGNVAGNVTGDTAESDLVYVELLSASSSSASVSAGTAPSDSTATVRCLFADKGAATIPASAFVLHVPALESGDGPAPEITRGTMIVHRIHREAFQVAGQPAGQVAGQVTGQVTGKASAGTVQGGIDSGVIRFDFARAAEFTRR